MEELREAHSKMEMRTLQILRTVETASRRRDVAVQEEYTQALRAASAEIQAKLWGDLARLKVEHERQIHTELRTIRRKFAASGGPVETHSVSTAVASPPPAPPAPSFDYASFEERFRGDEEFVSVSQSFYLPYFADLPRVVDLGCGRGEFLAGLRDRGADVLGVDLDTTALAACREKNIAVEPADIFEFLARQQDSSWDGVMCAHVIEHLPPLRLQELTDLCWRKLRPGGVVAFETPNPGCLAIFAGDFYLDPTHRAPVPSGRMHFHLRESGFGTIEITERHPAPEVFPELRALDDMPQTAAFRQKFFGGLDYAIIARKPAE
jgi:O-antigen chain-terminating methyltransferase